jgi:hypothetical protein
MSSRPAVKLSALRKIGQTIWDPIGLFDSPQADPHGPAADEYDSDLMAAFGMAQSGRTEAEISGYLAEIASSHMGLGKLEVDRDAHRLTARALITLAQGLT